MSLIAKAQLQIFQGTTDMHRMIYCPRTADGKKAPLSWPVALYRLFNSLCWPLEDNVSIWAYIYDRCYWILGFLIFLSYHDAEIRYMIANIQNLDEMLIGLPTYVILLETHLRAFQLGMNKERFKRFIKKFYAEIYVKETSEPQLFRDIRRSLMPVFLFSSFYMFTYISYMIAPIIFYIQQRKDTLYKMIFPFDINPLYIYIPVLLSNIWMGTIVITLVFGEANVMMENILHLNARYKIMRRDLWAQSQQLLENKDVDAKYIAKEFRRAIVSAVRENARLNTFAAELQREFSYRIFVMFALSAVVLCVLMFKIYTNPIASYSYMFWICSKVIEMLIIGNLGSVLTETTNQLSSMYYLCNWENAILRSSNSHENVRLMKLVLIAIEMNHKSFHLTGLNFFSVSLSAVLTILQAAGSYFTCLISLR